MKKKDPGLKGKEIRKSGLILMCSMLFFCTTVYAQQAIEQGGIKGILFKDISYKTGIQLSAYEKERCKLDIYLPEKKAAAITPVLVFFHGGGLVEGDKAGEGWTDWSNYFGYRFLEKGIAVVMVNYRLSGQQGAKWPAYLQDGASAVKWTIENNAKYGLSNDAIFVGGFSAGAYITHMLSSSRQWYDEAGVDPGKIKGYIPVSGQTRGHATVAKDLQVAEDSLLQRYPAAMPLGKKDKQEKPVYIFVGGKEGKTVLDNKAYYDQLVRSGSQHVFFYEQPGKDHLGIRDGMGDSGNELLNKVDDFISIYANGLTKAHKIKETTIAQQRLVQYQKSEWDIQVEGLFTNPYLEKDISLNMILSTPSGKKLLLPCYYEAGDGKQSYWKARFMPQEKGRYHYYFQLNKNRIEVDATAGQAIEATEGKGKGILHAKDNWTFQFDNGEPFRGIGLNIGWESRDNDDSKFFKELHEEKKYNYEQLLPALAQKGGNYFRTWICSWNLPLDWKAGFNNSRYEESEAYFNPSAIQKMDRLVALSDSLGIYMMLTLGSGAYDEKNGRYGVSTAQFFSDATAKEQYKDRLRFIVARWGYSPSIAAWEFFNEIDNIQFRDADNPIAHEPITAWHTEMSAYIKTIDPYRHLVTTSISHRDVEGLNDIAAIDFNQKHIYKNNRALSPAIINYTEKHKKPYVIGEYGYEWDWQKNFNDFAEEMDSDFKRGLWYGLFSPTPVLPLSWWWEFFENRGTDSYLQRVRTIADQMLETGKGSFAAIPVNVSNKGLEQFSVRCGKQSFIYLYNPTGELAETGLQLVNTGIGVKKASLYNCETGTYTPLKVKKKKNNTGLSGLRLNANSDVIIIFSEE